MVNGADISIRRDNGTITPVHLSAEKTAPKGSAPEDGPSYSAYIGMEDAGRFTFSKDKTEWLYTGTLSNEEQRQIAGFIQQFKGGDWDLVNKSPANS
jgi:hypothetical protein